MFFGENVLRPKTWHAPVQEAAGRCFHKDTVHARSGVLVSGRVFVFLVFKVQVLGVLGSSFSGLGLWLFRIWSSRFWKKKTFFGRGKHGFVKVCVAPLFAFLGFRCAETCLFVIWNFEPWTALPFEKFFPSLFISNFGVKHDEGVFARRKLYASLLAHFPIVVQ